MFVGRSFGGAVPSTPSLPFEGGTMSKLEEMQLAMRLRNADKALDVRAKRAEKRVAKYEVMKLVQSKRIEAPVYHRNREQRLELKESVLTFYGPRKNLGCCWEGCLVVDLDMLSLDHINDD